jgi:hypothetical protein
MCTVDAADVASATAPSGCDDRTDKTTGMGREPSMSRDPGAASVSPGVHKRRHAYGCRLDCAHGHHEAITRCGGPHGQHRHLIVSVCAGVGDDPPGSITAPSLQRLSASG